MIISGLLKIMPHLLYFSIRYLLPKLSPEAYPAFVSFFNIVIFLLLSFSNLLYEPSVEQLSTITILIILIIFSFSYFPIERIILLFYANIYI